MSNDNRFDTLAELRMRALRYVSQHGVSSEPNGPFGPKHRTADVENIQLLLIDGRQLKVVMERTHPVVYDSLRRASVYQDAATIEATVLPALRRAQVLDDLSSV